MNKKSIFIHSLFRTGSTYFWNKFRQNDQYYCYYEPFHQDFISLSAENTDLWEFDKMVTEKMHFPFLDRSFTFEYCNLFVPEKAQLSLFKKSFSFDEYCHNSSNPRMKKYLDSLIRNAKDKIPVLQFNRSALRIRWFKLNFPELIHLYLVRHPHDQFQSYINMMKNNQLDIFLVMDLMISGKNQSKGKFKILASRIPLVDFHNEAFENEKFIYSILSKCYSDWERYYIFYYIWFYSFYENVLNADFIINIDLLTLDLDYRKKVSRFLKKKGIDNVEFEDASIRKHQIFTLRKNNMKEIEKDIQTLFLSHTDAKDLDLFFSKIPNKDREFFDIRRRRSKHTDKEKIIDDYLPHPDSGKLEDFIMSLADELIHKKKYTDELQLDLEQIKPRLIQQEKQLADEMVDLFKECRISKLKEVNLIQKNKELEKINKELTRHAALLDEKSKKFTLKSHVGKRKDIQNIKKAQRSKEMRRELSRHAAWFEEKSQELTKQKLLLKKKTKLIKQKNQLLRSSIRK